MPGEHNQLVLAVVRERAEALGDGTVVVEIAGMDDRCRSAFLISRGAAHRVIVLDPWDESIFDGAKKIASGAPANRSRHLGEWHEVDAETFFAAQIVRTKKLIEDNEATLAHLGELRKNMKVGRDP